MGLQRVRLLAGAHHADIGDWALAVQQVCHGSQVGLAQAWAGVTLRPEPTELDTRNVAHPAGNDLTAMSLRPRVRETKIDLADCALCLPALGHGRANYSVSKRPSQCTIEELTVLDTLSD
jgi:hypothetical protein